MYALLSDSEEVIGRVGLRSASLANRAEVEVADSFLPDWWGRGITTAAVEQVVALASLAALVPSVAAMVLE